MIRAMKLLAVFMLTVAAYGADDFLVARDITAASDKITFQQQATNSRVVSFISIKLLCGAGVNSVSLSLDRDGTTATGSTELTPINVTSGSSAVPRFRVYGGSNNTAGTYIFQAQPMPCGFWQKLEDLDGLVLSRNGSSYNYSITMSTGAGSTRIAYQIKVRQQ